MSGNDKVTQLPYRAFMMRCWKEEDDLPHDTPLWRFSLEEVGIDGPRKGFTSLKALTAYLNELLGGDPADLNEQTS